MKNKIILSAIFLFAISCLTNAQQNIWTQKTNFGGFSVGNAMGFSIGNKGYIGTGNDSAGVYHKDFWEYDPASNAWTQKSDFGGGNRFGASAFAVGNKGYAGTGFDGTVNQNDFWEYNPTSNLWTQKAFFPASARRFALGFSIGTKGYMGLGYDGVGPYTNDIWEYDPSNDFWIQKANFAGGARANASGFSIGTKAYVGTGSAGASIYNDLWEYDQTNNLWTSKANVGPTLRSDAVGFSIGNKGYIGTGFTSGSVALQDFWEYNSTTDVWQQKANFSGAPRWRPVGFAINNKGYIGTGVTSTAYYRNFYEYTPSLQVYILSKTANTCIGGSDGSASTGAFGGVPPYTYNWTPSGGTGAIASGLAAGNFTVTITDAALATSSATVSISNPTTPNTWTQKADVAGGDRVYPISFSIGNKGYIGAGGPGNSGITNDFWEYDPATNIWTQKANASPIQRKGAISFSIGNKGYMILGSDGGSTLYNDTWEYDPALNTWTAKNPFTGPLRSAGIGFSIGSKGYLGLGVNLPGTIYFQDFYEFDPAGNSWTPKAAFPGLGVYICTAFSIGNKGYVGPGATSTGYLNEFWEYTASSDSWTKKPSYPGLSVYGSAAFSIGNRGYIGTGYENGGTRSAEFYEYNQSTNAWTQRAAFPGAPRFYAKGLSIGNKGYIGCGFDAGNYDFYEYTPILSAGIISHTDVTCNLGNDGVINGVASAGTPPYTYSWAPSGGTNATASNLVAGIYTLTVTDACANTATTSVTITQPSPNTWVQKTNFGGATRRGAVGFSIGSKGYIGTGVMPAYSKDFWEWDQATNTWTQKADFGGTARLNAVGFSIGNKGYVGTGEDVSSTNQNDFWEYDPSTNVWTPKQPLSGSIRQNAVGFSIGNKGYIGTGENAGSFFSDFYEYDPTTNGWILKAPFGGGQRREAVGFSIGSKGYIGTGYDGSTNPNDFWEYDQAGDSWSPKQNFGGPVRNNAVGFSIGNKGYIGTGDAGGVEKLDLWEWDQAGNAWTQRTNFSGAARFEAVGFSIGDKGYIGTGRDYGGTSYNNFYEYYPVTITTVAAFSNTQAGQTVTFANTSTNANSYLWDFGDGTTSNSSTPVHTYSFGGSYNVCLTAYGFCANSTVCHTVTTSCAVPASSFTNSVNGLTVNFTSTSTNAATYLWNFGDGNTSALQNPTHVYSNTGTFTVTLTVSNACGTNPSSQTVTTNCVAPNAFTTFTTSGLTVNFTNNSTNAANILWQFGDGNTSNTTNPSHVYNNGGTYNVNLIVSNGCGADTFAFSVTVNCALPQSVFSYFPSGLSVSFYGASSVNAFTYAWDFGDGNLGGNFPIPPHTYTLSGTYNVCLTTTNSCGSDTKCDSVTVCLPPSASTFTITPATTSVSVNYSGQATNYLWYFNDNTASNQNPATHTYAASGPKTICLKASNSCGSDSVCKNIYLFCSSGNAPQICMATVDSASMYNEIFWDKTGYLPSDTFIVYRDTANNNYASIGKIPYDSLSWFADTVRTLYAANGDPNVSSWRYKLAVEDSCGNISPMSPYHQTMFFQNSSGNFSWNHYQIEGQTMPVPALSNYKFKRDDLSTGVWNTIQLLSASSTAYTDPSYATYQSTGSWRTETQWTITCNPSYRTGSDPDLMSIVNTSRSNIKHQLVSTGINKLSGTEISIYPNPAKNEITVNCGNEKIKTIELADVLGQIVFSSSQLPNHPSTHLINISHLSSGIYFVNVIAEGEKRIVKKVVKE